MSSTQQIAQEVESQKPRVVYLSGKTSTGKTTFAKELERHGYKIIELDPIVTASVVVPFGVLPGEGFITAYRDIGPKEQTGAFITAAKARIEQEVQSSPVIVEGAIATPRILKEVLSGDLADFYFVYFHPVNLDVYAGRIRERFVAGAASGKSGLPKHFWSLVQKADTEHFINTGEVNLNLERVIEKYAELSMQESAKRLASFQEEFENIHLIEV